VNFPLFPGDREPPFSGTLGKGGFGVENQLFPVENAVFLKKTGFSGVKTVIFEEK
jgi:hypothetical protein